MFRWYKVCREAELKPGSSRSIRLFGRPFAVFNIDGNIYGMDGACRHMKANLAAGKLNGCVVECFMHGWQYDVTSGKCLNQEHGDVRTFPAKREDGHILIGVEWPPAAE